MTKREAKKYLGYLAYNSSNIDLITLTEDDLR